MVWSASQADHMKHTADLLQPYVPAVCKYPAALVSERMLYYHRYQFAETEAMNKKHPDCSFIQLDMYIMHHQRMCWLYHTLFRRLNRETILLFARRIQSFLDEPQPASSSRKRIRQ